MGRYCSYCVLVAWARRVYGSRPGFQRLRPRTLRLARGCAGDIRRLLTPKSAGWLGSPIDTVLDYLWAEPLGETRRRGFIGAHLKRDFC